MESIEPTCSGNGSDDFELWGPRPVLWGLCTLAPDPRRALKCVSPKHYREVLDFLGFSPFAIDDENIATERIATLVSERRAELLVLGDIDSTLYRNLRHLQHALHFNDIELDLIAFRAMIRLHHGFRTLADAYIGSCVDRVFRRKLALLFGVPVSNVVAALAPGSRLVSSGIVHIKPGVSGPLEERIHLLRGLDGSLSMPAASAAALLTQVLPPVRKAHLALECYPHLSQEIAMLRDHLGVALTTHSSGANVLLYGQPGTGKTELAAAIAASLACPLYEVGPASSSDRDLYGESLLLENGKSLTPRDRIHSLMQVQKLASATGHGVVLVDEAEDLFPTFWSDSEKVPTKATINQCLETNPTPTIWINNHTHRMDEAFLRRFDLVIHVPSLPASAKARFLCESLPVGAISDSEVRRLATRSELSPAVITRTARVVSAVGRGDACLTGANFRVLFDHYLRALGTAPAPTPDSDFAFAYDIDLTNTQPGLNALVEKVATSAIGVRMLLHGAPGTGKTAFAKMLADRLDRPLLRRQASSLLSMWVGGTERNLRDMFEEARRDAGVLLLDEADSFLRDRERARAQWEATQVNELLTQMEVFDGTLLCTTNRLDDLDPAALRRFDIKVEFKPLRGEQRVLLVRRCCSALGLDADSSETDWQDRARRMDGLTPGDVVPVLRRLRWSSCSADIGELLDALTDECRYRQTMSKPIGFLR